MYNMDTELGQMMAFLWDMLEEGEYSDAATLAKQMLQDDPNNKEAVSVLAIVYEKMADASRDGGDEENEKEFLKNSLSQYLKLLALDPDSVAEKIKVSKIKKRLNGDTGADFDENFVIGKWQEYKDKFGDFYAEKIAKYPVEKWLKIGIVVLPVIIVLCVGLGLYNKYTKADNEVATAPTNDDFSSNINPDYQNNINTYQGPTDTIIIENDNAKAERAEKELEEQYNRQVAQSQTQGTETPKTVRTRTPQRVAVQNNYSDYNQNQNIPPSLGVKPLKLPFTDVEIKPGKESEEQNTVSNSQKDIKSNPAAQRTVASDNETKKPAAQKSNRLKRADALMERAIKEHDSGNVEEAKRNAREAKALYNEEISNGSNSRRARTNIETADTIIGND